MNLPFEKASLDSMFAATKTTPLDLLNWFIDVYRICKHIYINDNKNENWQYPCEEKLYMGKYGFDDSGESNTFELFLTDDFTDGDEDIYDMWDLWAKMIKNKNSAKAVIMAFKKSYNLTVTQKEIFDG